MRWLSVVCTGCVHHVFLMLFAGIRADPPDNGTQVQAKQTGVDRLWPLPL